MLVINKGNITLMVQFHQSAVRILPARGPFDNLSLLTTLARNEELLAQVHLSRQDSSDTYAQLAEDYNQRGWLVKPPGHQEP